MLSGGRFKARWILRLFFRDLKISVAEPSVARRTNLQMDKSVHNARGTEASMVVWWLSRRLCSSRFCQSLNFAIL